MKYFNNLNHSKTYIQQKYGENEASALRLHAQLDAVSTSAQGGQARRVRSVVDRCFVISLVLVVLFSLVFVCVAALVVQGVTTAFDAHISQELPRNDGLTSFIKIFTNIGSVWGLIAISLICLLLCRERGVGLGCLFSVAASGVFAVVAKYIVRRARPEIMMVSETGYSFPSAHALMTAAVFFFLIFSVCKLLKCKRVKIPLVFVLALSILFIPYTRIYLSVHHFTDVLAGISFGAVVAVFSAMLFDHETNYCQLLVQIRCRIRYNIKPKSIKKDAINRQKSF